MPSKTRLNYSISAPVAEALEQYCRVTGRRAAEVARQVILDFLDDPEALVEPQTEHPNDKRADLWLHQASLDTLDRKQRQGGHVSRSALINHLLAVFLENRQVPQEVQVTVNVPTELWKRLGADPEAAILRAVEASLSKELV